MHQQIDENKSDTTCEVLAKATMPECEIEYDGYMLSIRWMGESLIVPTSPNSQDKIAQWIINNFREVVLLTMDNRRKESEYK